MAPVWLLDVDSSSSAGADDGVAIVVSEVAEALVGCAAVEEGTVVGCTVPEGNTGEVRFQRTCVAIPLVA